MKWLHPPMNDARPRSVGRAPRTAVLRSLTPHRRRRLRRSSLAASVALLCAASPAQASSVTVQNAFAGPIAATNRVCTAEPRGLIYGTMNYNPGSALSYLSDGLPGPGYYVPANGPSYLDLEPALLAGARSDLCAGFTLPPAAEPALIRTLAQPGDRLQDATAWPDLPETHVAPAAPGDPAPDGDDPRRIRIDLPAGTGLSLAGQTTCSAAEFGAGSYAAAACPAGSQVGDALVRLSTWHASQARHLALPSAKVYLLASGGPDAVATFGLTVRPLSGLTPIKVLLSAQLTTTGRLQLSATDLPRALYATSDVLGDGSLDDDAQPRPIYLESLGLRLWGSRDDHPTLAKDFVASAADCSAPLPGAITVETYAGTTSTAEPSTLALSGCGSLGYAPTVAVALDDPRPAASTGATITLNLGGTGPGRRTTSTRSAQVRLPAGLRLGAQLASGGLQLCSAEAFAADAPQASDCPEASSIGTAALASDLTSDPLRGEVFVTAPLVEGDLAGLAVDLAPPGAAAAAGVRLKLRARLQSDGGRLAVLVEQLPLVPVGALSLTFRGGEHGVLTAPPACADLTADALFTPAAGEAAAATSTVTVNADCAEQVPTVAAEVQAESPTPAARAGVALTLTRPDRSPSISTFSARLPAGVAADLRGVSRCERGAVDAGSCPESAVLGRVQLALGAGSAPTRVSAPLVRLTDDDSALAAGLARIPVRLGELDLGTVEVPVALGFDTAAGRLIVAAAVPSAVQGATLDVQSVRIALAGTAAVNPTSCAPLPLSASAEFAGGARATASATLQLSSCASQSFAPTLRATISGESGIGGHPRAALSIAARAGDANLAAAAITLPGGLGVDTTHATCDAAAFAVDQCPAATRIGSVTATSGLVDGATGGTLTLVRIPGQALPGIGLAVSGSYGFRAVAPVTTTAGRQVASFAGLPDLPFTQLDLVFDGGASGGLRIAAQVCTAGAAWSAAFTGQGGQVAQSAAPVACQARATGPTIELGVKAKTGLKLKLSGFGTLRLQSAKLTLPARLRFATAAARQRRNVSVAVIGPATKATFSSTSLTLAVGAGKAPQEVVARVRWPAMLLSARGPRAASFRLRLAFADGSVQVRDVRVTLPSAAAAPAPRSDR